MWQYIGKHRPSFALPVPDGKESVWDYPRPPVCVPDRRRVIVKLDEQLIAESTRVIRVLETASPPTVYLPPEDVDLSLLQKEGGSSFCEWKGAATYYSVKTLTGQIPRAAWSYDSPQHPFGDIAGYFSFYPSLLTCTIDNELVRPQGGGFYGGWVTADIVGPWKGEPGTGGW